MWAGIVQGARDAAPEAGGLALLVLLVWLAWLACDRWDRAAARRRRRAIAEARALEGQPAWVTPGPYRPAVRCRPSPHSRAGGGQLEELDAMLVRSRRRVGAR